MNMKLPSLQALIDDVGDNSRLQQFLHTSSTSVSEMILLIADQLSNEIIVDLKHSTFWASLVEITTDVATHQQYITFIHYFKGGKV